MIRSLQENLLETKMMHPYLKEIASNYKFGELGFEIVDPRKVMHRETALILTDIEKYGGLAAFVEVYCFGKLLESGIKTFCVGSKTINYDVISNIDIQVPMQHYAQPYPTVAVEFPPDWTDTLEVDCVESISEARYGWGIKHKPVYLVLHLGGFVGSTGGPSNRSVLFCSVILSSQQVYTIYLIPDSSETMIEAELERAKNKGQTKGSLE